MTISIAIVGAGPSGFYTAQALIGQGLDCAIDIIEMLPSPYGLIRAGVAPDHQHTKRVSRTYETTAEQAPVAYFGNVRVGRDVSVEDLREIYDAVVLAIGAPFDRGLDLIGGTKEGVLGAAEFVGWYNGHPEQRGLNPGLATPSVGIIGNGNVALDIARVLAKSRDELRVTDMPEDVLEAIDAAPIEDIHVFGRRGPAEAKFTNVELREMGRLENAVPVVEADDLPESVGGGVSDRDRRLVERNLATFRDFAALDPAGKRRRVHFRFNAMPVQILGGKRAEGLRLQRTRVENGEAMGTGEFFDVPCGLVIAAIGYRMGPLPGVPLDGRRGIVINREGRVADGLYVVGWAKRGPIGVIASNKPDAETAAGQIAGDITEGGKPGRAALENRLRERGVRWIDFAGWRGIDAAEVAAAADGAPRRKFLSVDEMLDVLAREADADPA